MKPSVAQRAALFFAAAFILPLTLYPTSAPETWSLLECLVCGPRGWADALLNVLLFVPFGAGLALRGAGVASSLLFGAIFSSLIEGAQIFVPGRHTSAGDVIFNALGTALGAWIFAKAGALVRLGDQEAGYASLAAAAAAGVVLLGTAVLLQPTIPLPPYLMVWTPESANGERYGGTVLEARLVDASSAVAPQEMTRVEAVVRGYAAMHIRAIAAPSGERLMPLVSIFGRTAEPIFAISANGRDIVFRYRTRAARLRLDQPNFRIRGVMQGIASGDALLILAWRERDRTCARVNERERCVAGLTLARGWSLLLYSRAFPVRLMEMLDAGWIAALLVPFGFWARRRRETLLGATLLFALLALLPSLFGLRALSGTAWLGAAAGLGLGAALRALLPSALHPRVPKASRSPATTQT